MSSSVVFISYRREDSAGHAGRLFDRLVDHLGRDHVFRDIESIEPGEQFADSIRKRLATCDVLLALIGPRWLSATDPHGRKRREDATDLVRREIELGLERRIRVSPVLLPGATMPSPNELPESLAPLAQHNAIEIREAHFDHDAAELIKIIGSRRRSRLLRLMHARYVFSSLIGAVAIMTIAVFFWINPLIFMTPERARLQLMGMGLNYDSATFVRRANDGDSAAVKLFLRAGISVDETPFQQTPIVAAAEEGHLAIVKALAEAGANVNPALIAAGRGESKAVLDYLLTRNPRQDSVAGALDASAGQGNHIEYVRDLLDRGVAVDSDWGGTPLMTAAYYGNLNIVVLLLERGANVKAVNRDGGTALHYAARGGRSFEVVATLVSRGAPVNAQDQAGSTALMNGLENREITELLLTHGADVKLRTKGGETALQYAAGQNRVWLVKPLIDRGADVNSGNNAGQTPLMWATGAVDSLDKSEMAQVLIDNGADVNLADHDGKTALMFAVERGLASSIRVLLRQHARTTMRDKEGETALDLAKKSGRRAIVKLLSEER